MRTKRKRKGPAQPGGAGGRMPFEHLECAQERIVVPSEDGGPGDLVVTILMDVWSRAILACSIGRSAGSSFRAAMRDATGAAADRSDATGRIVAPCRNLHVHGRSPELTRAAERSAMASGFLVDFAPPRPGPGAPPATARSDPPRKAPPGPALDARERP